MSASKYVLLAEVFYLRQEDGSRKRYRTGDVVDGLSDEQVSRLLKAKAIATQGAAGSDEAGEPDDGKPAKVANKALLVEWLVENVTKDDGSEFTAEELDEMTKPKLWELIDSVEG